MKKTLVYSLTTLIIATSLILFLVSCGGDGTSNISSGINQSQDTGSVEINIDWPDSSKDISAQVIHPDVVQIFIGITGTGLSGQRQETITKGTTNKTIASLPVGDKQFEFSGLNGAGNTISHRITNVIVIKGQTVKITAHMGVTISSNGFFPQSIPVSPGDTLFWKNNDTVVHNVVAADASFNSGDIAVGSEWSRKFDTAGTFTYTCTHTNKSGTVVVETTPSISNVKKTSETSYDESMVETGTEVSIVGANFGASQGSVTIDGITARINSWTDTLIKVIVPGAAMTGTGQNKVVQVTTASNKIARWDELFINSLLETWFTKSYTSKEAFFNADHTVIYDIAARNVYSYTVSATPTPLNNCSFSTDTSFGCFCSDNSRIYVSSSDIDSWNSSLSDHTQITSIYANSEGIRWHPILRKLFLIAGSKLYSFKTDGTNHQLHYTDPSDLTAIDIDSDGYIYLTANTRIISLTPSLSLSGVTANLTLAKYIYVKKIDSNTKLLFVTCLYSNGYNGINVYKIKNNSTITLIKTMQSFNININLAGIYGSASDGILIVVDENQNKIYFMLF